jgi:Xaa-Pro aminopeptidase
MPDNSIPRIPPTEYAARRKRVRAALKRSVGVVFAGDYTAQINEVFRPHAHFEYLTGLTDEHNAVLVLDPGCPDPLRREMLFLRPHNPELEHWDGWRLSICEELRKKTGIHTIYRTYQLARFLSEPARRSKSLACLHPLAWHDQPVSPDLALFRKLAERIPDAEIVDRTELLAEMRAVKSPNERKIIQRAIDITALGYEALLKSARPGMNESELQEILEHTCRANGARGQMFRTIMGAGINSTVLHYLGNDQPTQAGDLICIDAGARIGSGACGYGADITRTIPVSGKFTKRQRQIYELVLAAQTAAINIIKPGVTFSQLDKAARDVVVKAGYGDYFIHGIGHHIGLEVHDVTPFGPIKAGSITTVEPGVYIPDENLGVRIEDDVLVTKTGRRVLSARIPKTAAAIEKLMSS